MVIPSRFIPSICPVKGDNLTGDEGSSVGRQKNYCLSDLFNRSRTFERRAGDQAGFRLGSAGKPVEHLGLDRTGCDGVDADTEGGAALVSPSTACLLAMHNDTPGAA